MKDFIKAINKSKEAPKPEIPEGKTRAEMRRIIKHELRIMESKLGERGFGKRLCKEYKLKNSLKNRYFLTLKVWSVMLERGQSEKELFVGGENG